VPPRAGPPAGPALFFLIAATLALAVVGASAPTDGPESGRHARRRVTDAILGIRIGSEFEKAAQTLAPYLGGKEEERGEDDEASEADRGEGRKRVWKLKSSAYGFVVVVADARGKVAGVSGFARAGREIPFSRFGDLREAQRAGRAMAVWNVRTPKGAYRLVAKGENGKARVVSLFSLALPPIE
jgi:hypothetical protein